MKMELNIITTDGNNKGKIQLPVIFNERIRSDIIKRAVEALEANRKHKYGASQEAGKRASAKLSRRRNDYKAAYGHGISRVPRKILSARGTRFNWVAAVAPGTVGGRRAHPPKQSKRYDKKINSKENRLAIRSALSASIDKALVQLRGHRIPDNYPFVADGSIESITKTRDLISALTKMGFVKEMERTQHRKVRAGRGKSRGRKYATKKGLLIITSSKVNLQKSCANIPGFEISTVESLNAKLLAPGGVPGRAILLTSTAVDKISKERLFTENRIKKPIAKKSGQSDSDTKERKAKGNEQIIPKKTEIQKPEIKKQNKEEKASSKKSSQEKKEIKK